MNNYEYSVLTSNHGDVLGQHPLGRALLVRPDVELSMSNIDEQSVSLGHGFNGESITAMTSYLVTHPKLNALERRGGYGIFAHLAAGRELGMAPAVASARLAKLESGLGADDQSS